MACVPPWREMDYEDRTFTLLEHMLLDESAEPKDLPLSFLERITKFFSDDRKIGSGGSAVVYKGRLGNGWSVAVKKLFDTINMDEAKYNEEVACLMRVRHENIVRFLGYCADTHGQMWDHEGKFVMADVRHRLLCFEYLHKGSLDCHLTDDASDGLNWRQRYQIIKGICKGLCYLHEKRIVHLDLKPANILLDDDMVPKICDFGISRCFSEEQTRTITSKTAGSIGYMAPESIIDGVITLKSDIYSLGVILKKLLTAQKGPLGDHVLESWRNRLEISLADTRLEQVRVCAEISIHCVNFDPTKRPDIQSIIQKLAETEGSDEYVESCTSTLVAQEEKLSARRFTMTSGAKAPYTSGLPREIIFVLHSLNIWLWRSIPYGEKIRTAGPQPLHKSRTTSPNRPNRGSVVILPSPSSTTCPAAAVWYLASPRKAARLAAVPAKPTRGTNLLEAWQEPERLEAMAEKLAPEKRHAFVHNGQKVFEWDQTLEEVNMYIELPKGVPTKLFRCTIQAGHIEVSIRGNPPYLNHGLTHPVKTDSSFWTIEDGEMNITLQKREKGKAWSSPIQGQGLLDPYAADQEQKRLMLQRFQEENPGFDFSEAQFSGNCPDPRTFMGGIRSD